MATKKKKVVGTSLVRVASDLLPFIDLLAKRFEGEWQATAGTCSKGSAVRGAVLCYLRDHGGLPEQIDGVFWTGPREVDG